MDTTNLNNISEDLYMLLLSFNKRVFNPGDLIKRFNGPPSQVKVLFYLIHHGAASISEIGNDLDISKPNMTPIIDKLVAEDLVRRVNDLNDRRIIRIEATQNACKFLKSHEVKVKTIISEKLSILSDEDIKVLNDSIVTMNTIISKLP